MSRELYERLEHNEYGQALVESSRWSSFKPDWMPTSDWEHVLGADVNNYRHMGYMAGLTEQYLTDSDNHDVGFTDDEKDLLIATAYVHDFAEAIDGDIPDPEKVHSVQAYEDERRSFIEVLSSVTREPETVAKLILPVMQGRSLLSHHWRAIEIIGYTETTLKAQEVTASPENLEKIRTELNYNHEQMSELTLGLLTMAGAVHQSNVKELEKFAWLPGVGEYRRRRCIA